jgi:hypothetical protein
MEEALYSIVLPIVNSRSDDGFDSAIEEIQNILVQGCTSQSMSHPYCMMCALIV